MKIVGGVPVYSLKELAEMRARREQKQRRNWRYTSWDELDAEPGRKSVSAPPDDWDVTQQVWDLLHEHTVVRGFDLNKWPSGETAEFLTDPGYEGSTPEEFRLASMASDVLEIIEAEVAKRCASLAP